MFKLERVAGTDTVRLSGSMGPRQLRQQFDQRFEGISDAMQWAEENDMQVADNEMTLGWRLGAIAVGITEGKLNREEIIESLLETTDSAHRTAIRQLAEILSTASARM